MFAAILFTRSKNIKNPEILQIQQFYEEQDVFV